MKKKSLIILLFIMCIGYFMPTEVFARDYNVWNNVHIDYRFKTDEMDKNEKFKLYDSSSSLYFESSYDFESNLYYFNENEEGFDTDISGFEDSLWHGRNEFGENEFRQYVGNFSKLSMIEDDVAMEQFINENKYHGHCENRWGRYHCNYYTYIPMILEEISSNANANPIKKIVFASINVTSLIYYMHYDYTEYYVRLFLVNNVANINSDGVGLGDSFSDNVEFIRNAMYDYSDELWEELNSGSIASSEMQYDNSDYDLSSPKLITFKTNDNKSIYSKYKSDVNYRFKVKNGNGMNFKLHDISNTFNFSSQYDKDSDTYSIVDNSTDTDYQDGIKEFSKIIIDEVKNGNFSGLADKYKSITSDNCTSTNCNIYTYIPLILEGDNKDNYAKQIVLGLVDIQYRQENGNDYYDIGLNVYNNTCDLLESNIDANQSDLINLSRAIEKDYSSSLMNQYSDGSIALEDIYKDVDVNTLKDEYCNDIPIITLRQNPKTLNNGVLVLIISMIVIIGSSYVLIKKKS